MKKLLLKFSLILVGILLALFSAEAYLHFFKPQKIHSSLPKEMDCYKEDKNLFAVFKPNSICVIKTSEFEIKNRINNLGFRGKRVEINKTEGVKRVAFIGDSYTFGWGVEENESFPGIIQTNLDLGNENIEMINAGIPGVGVDYYYLMLKKILPLKPDLAVVGIYLGTDLTDLNFYQWVGVDEKGLPTKIDSFLEYVDAEGSRRSERTPTRYKLPLLANSHLFIFLTNTLFGEIGKLDEINLHSSGSNCLVKPNCHELDLQIEKIKNLILEMSKLSKEHKFSLEIALIPWEGQLPRNLTKRSDYPIFVPDHNRHIISDMLANFLKENNINYIDLLPLFETYSGPDQVFYPNDKHWTKVGHQIAAEAIFPDIVRFLNLP